MNDSEKAVILDLLLRRGVIVIRSERLVDANTRVSWVEHGGSRDVDVPNALAEEYLGIPVGS